MRESAKGMGSEVDRGHEEKYQRPPSATPGDTEAAINLSMQAQLEDVEHSKKENNRDKKEYGKVDIGRGREWRLRSVK